jgi:hypothetical protein
MDSVRDSLKTGYTLRELARAASAAQDGRPGGHGIGSEQGDWLAESLLEATGYHRELEKLEALEKREELEKLKEYIKTHVKAYTLGIQCVLGVVLLLQVVCLVRLFWGQ